MCISLSSYDSLAFYIQTAILLLSIQHSKSKHIFVQQILPKVQSFPSWKFKISWITCRFCSYLSKKKKQTKPLKTHTHIPLPSTGSQPSFIHLTLTQNLLKCIYFLNLGCRKNHWVALVLRTGELCCRCWRVMSSALLVLAYSLN